MDFLVNNIEWFLIGFYALEKCIRLSSTKADDVLLDMIIMPIWNKLPFKK